MSAYKSAYLSLFNRVTDSLSELNNVLGISALPVDALRSLGMISENLKQSQSIAEELIVSQDLPL